MDYNGDIDANNIHARKSQFYALDMQYLDALGLSSNEVDTQEALRLEELFSL